MKIRPVLILLVAIVVLPMAAHAQNGCVNSPENPTALLALVGATAFFLGKRKP